MVTVMDGPPAMNTTFRANYSLRSLRRVAIEAGDWVERVGRLQAHLIAPENEIVFGAARAACPDSSKRP
jgi:hypothetical protein